MWLDRSKFNHFKFATCDSTNLVAKQLVAGGAEFAIVRSDEQSRGRTTKPGQVWDSPKGNLFFTMLVRLPPALERRFSEISLVAAVATVESVLHFEPEADIAIKWPNDILLKKQKVGGILIEKEDSSAIIGIGLNVAVPPDRKNIRYPAACLAECGIKVAEVKEVAEALEIALIKALNLWKDKGFDAILERAKPYMYHLGKNVFVSSAGKDYEGTFIGLAPSGGIIISTDRGEMTLVSGELTKENFT
ncbi:MAG: biotin--[acetyl-CoA-carboxylase] ligase [Rickettsiales bacterium]|jgi:BirA family biotin operon repressor/biotin-[acetyl-CoA-carboxylase] ligase|nr:biotin--[acetyl-CoA-carboxylase] ligase [Rickettsiales bacterium]